MGGEPVGAAIGRLEGVDRRRDLVGFGAPRPIARPFLLDLLLATALGDIADADPADSEDAQQQGIFDAGAEGAHPFGVESPQERAFLRVVRRQQDVAEQGVEMVGVARP